MNQTKHALDIIEMVACPDDCAIDNLGPYNGSLLEIYDNVKKFAIDFVNEKANPKEYLVEMMCNSDGYPTAEIWNNNKIIARYFATPNMYRSIEERRYESPVGSF